MPLRFYSAWFCPFAQRVWFVLLLKDIDHEYIEVDPYRVSNWWLKISRQQAEVPVIVSNETDGETTIIDSTRIVEYLDELRPEVSSLMQGSPEQRAELKHWASHINTNIVPYLYQFLQATQAGEERDTARDSLMGGIQQLFATKSSSTYLSGEAINILDVLLIPFALRIDILLSHYRDFQLPDAGGIWPQYQEWYQTLKEHPKFRVTMNKSNYREALIESYYSFSQGLEQKDMLKND